MIYSVSGHARHLKGYESNMNKDIITLGNRIGSTTSKCVIMHNGSEIISKQIVSAVSDKWTGRGTERLLQVRT